GRDGGEDQRGAVVAQAAVALADEEGRLDVGAARDELRQAGAAWSRGGRGQAYRGDPGLYRERHRARSCGAQVDRRAEAVGEGQRSGAEEGEGAERILDGDAADRDGEGEVDFVEGRPGVDVVGWRPGRAAVAVDAVEDAPVDRDGATADEAAGLGPGVGQQGEIGRGRPRGGRRLIDRDHDLPGRGGVPRERDVLEVTGEQRPGRRPGAEQRAAGGRAPEAEIDHDAGPSPEATAVADAGGDGGTGRALRG